MIYENTYEEQLGVKVSKTHLEILSRYCERHDMNKSQVLRMLINSLDSPKIEVDINNPDHIAHLAEAVAKYNQAKK